MNLEKKLLHTLDGDYWLSNETASKRNRQKRQMHEFCRKFSAKKRRVVSQPLFQDTYMLPKATEPTQRSDNADDFEKNVLCELKRLNDKTEKISSRQISLDAWYRYLQHFEQNIAELREILLEKTLQKEKISPSDVQEEKSASREQNLITTQKQKESLNDLINKQEYVNQQCQTEKVACIENKEFDDLQKQEEVERSEIAQAMLELTPCDSAVQNLHYFQLNNDYTWIAVDMQAKKSLLISQETIQLIEENYKKMLRIGKVDSSSPYIFKSQNIVINFQTREGSVDGVLVQFSRIRQYH